MRLLCSLVMLLSFLVIVTDISVLFGDRLRVSAASPSRDSVQSNRRAVTLNENAQRKPLRHAPMEFSKAAERDQVVMTLPMPDGKLARFRVEESPVMASRLAAMFPEIRTYRGQGLDDPTATTRFDVTPAGFHAIVLSAKATVIIEPEKGGRAGQYVSYDQRDALRNAGPSNCLLSNESLSQPPSQPLRHSSSATLPATTGGTLRTYRLALAATAEYTQLMAVARSPAP